jgi:hypothetical protein
VLELPRQDRAPLRRVLRRLPGARLERGRGRRVELRLDRAQLARRVLRREDGPDHDPRGVEALLVQERAHRRPGSVQLCRERGGQRGGPARGVVAQEEADERAGRAAARPACHEQRGTSSARAAKPTMRDRSVFAGT